MSFTKKAATFALVASQAVTAQADENNGWFTGVGYEQDVDAYTLNVPTSMFAAGPALDYLPSSISMNIHSNQCTNAYAGHRWSGGNTNLGGFSWSFSTAVKASRCNSGININLAPIKSHVIGKIGETVHSTISTTMGSYMPPEVLSFAGMYGVDINGLMNQSAYFMTNYIMDPTQPLPTTEDVQLTFDSIPAVSNPTVTAIINDARDIAFETASTINQVRDAVNFVYSFPDQVEGNGRMFALAIKSSFETRYRFSEESYFYAGVNAEATARASFHANPFPQIADQASLIVPFYGIETTVHLGVAFENAIDDLDIAGGYNHPFSTFDIPVDGITLIRKDDPYLNLSISNNNGVTVNTTYIPQQNQAGFTVNLNF